MIILMGDCLENNISEFKRRWCWRPIHWIFNLDWSIVQNSSLLIVFFPKKTKGNMAVYALSKINQLHGYALFHSKNEG